MSEHVKARGKAMILEIAALGRILGYDVRNEHPVRSTGRSKAAVDQAWFADAIQRYPLFIFEVESQATNAMTHNAVKVFGQSNEDFEKPLFFFHIVLSGGKNSSRIDALRSEYANPNYRIYIFDQAERVRWLKDVLSQHRRLSGKLDLLALAGYLRSGAGSDKELTEILDHVERAHFACPFIWCYAVLATESPFYQQRYLAYLDRWSRSKPQSAIASHYRNYLGQHWSDPIHLAILTRSGKLTRAQFLARLKAWQHPRPDWSVIAPNFGLSRDYDEFILTLASPYCAAVAAVAGAGLAVRTFLAEVVYRIFIGLKPPSVGVNAHTAIWLLHLSAKLSDQTYYEAARAYLNQIGGIALGELLCPPFGVSLGDEDGWIKRLQTQPQQIPTSPEFLALLHAEISDLPLKSGLDLAFALLTLPENPAPWAPTITQLLASE